MKPYYNPVNLEKAGTCVKQKEFIQSIGGAPARAHTAHQRSGRRVGISSSALRSWEALGLVTPQRTQSRYRLFTESDVRLLQRAIFLRRARGLNPPAIVHVLKRQGVVSAPAKSSLLPGQRFRRLRTRRGLSLAQVARADRKSTRLNSSHTLISEAVFCLHKKDTRVVH